MPAGLEEGCKFKFGSLVWLFGACAGHVFRSFPCSKFLRP
jgi:hypothetical protein